MGYLLLLDRHNCLAARTAHLLPAHSIGDTQLLATRAAHLDRHGFFSARRERTDRGPSVRADAQKKGAPEREHFRESLAASRFELSTSALEKEEWSVCNTNLTTASGKVDLAKMDDRRCQMMSDD